MDFSGRSQIFTQPFWHISHSPQLGLQDEDYVIANDHILDSWPNSLHYTITFMTKYAWS